MEYFLVVWFSCHLGECGMSFASTPQKWVADKIYEQHKNESALFFISKEPIEKKDYELEGIK